MRLFGSSGFALGALAAVFSAAGCGGADGRLVARTDFDVPPDWARPSILGETFRPLLQNEGKWSVGGKAFEHQKNWAENDLAAFRDCAVNYKARQRPVQHVKSGRVPGGAGVSTDEMPTYAHLVPNPPAEKTLTLEDFFGPGPAWQALCERARPQQPFFIACHEARPAFFLKRRYETDRAGFADWKRSNPNFLGFTALDEFDSDAFFYCWKGKEQFPKMEPALQRHFAEGFPFPKGQYAWTNLVAEAWARSASLLFGETNLWPMCSGYYSLNHIFARFGAAGLWYEATGQGCPRWQVAGAFTRGAARQWKLPFCWYQAHFMSLYRRGDFTKLVCGNNRWQPKPDAFGGRWVGFSRELFNRQSLYGWLIGSSFNAVEDWSSLFAEADAQGVRRPNAFARDFVALSALHRRLDRGVAYTPLALLVPLTDRYSCWGHTDDITDDISQNSFHLTLVPIRADFRQTALRRAGDEGCFFNSPFGEIYDVLTPDSGQPTADFARALSAYKCAFLVGTYRAGDVDAAALRRYVADGGTLVVSADQVMDGHVPADLSGVSFDGACVASGERLTSADGDSVRLENPYSWLVGAPRAAKAWLTDERGGVAAWRHACGKGRVVTVAARKMRTSPELDKAAVARGEKSYDLIRHLLARVQEETMPVVVRGDVQWGVNKTAKGYLVWLFNNRGVTHYSGEEPQLDPTAVARAEVRLAVRATRVADAVDGREVSVNGGALEVSVPPGGYRLLKVDL